VRQRHGKGKNAKHGTKCTRGKHKRKDCWAYLDDELQAANLGKGRGDHLDRLVELRAKQAQGKGKAEAKSPVADNDSSVYVNGTTIVGRRGGSHA